MSPLLQTPTWIGRLSRFFLLALSLGVAFLFLPWQQFTAGEGRVIGLDPNDRFQEIHAPISGFIKQWHVREGSFVKKGQLMVSLSDTDLELMDRLEVDRSAAENALKASQLALSTARINLQRQEQLFREGLTARKDWEKERIKVAKLEVEVTKAQSTLLKSQSGLARQQTQDILAPRDGQVVRMRNGEGAQIVKQGDALLVLAPSAPKSAVEIWVDGNDVALIKEKAYAQVAFAGFPAIQIPGWPSLAIGTFDGEVALVDTVASKQGKFRVLIVPKKPWPSERFVRQGVRANGVILMETVTIGWELWRQFNGIPIKNDLLEDEVQGLLTTKKSEETKEEK